MAEIFVNCEVAVDAREVLTAEEFAVEIWGPWWMTDAPTCTNGTQ